MEIAKLNLGNHGKIDRKQTHVKKLNSKVNDLKTRSRLLQVSQPSQADVTVQKSL